MPGLWLPWFKGLTRRREVVVMAARRNCDRRLIAGAMMDFWEWADDEGGEYDSEGGLFIAGVTEDFVDQLLQLDQISRDMCATGWLEVRDGGIYLPHFGRKNGRTAKARLLSAKRQEKHRDIRNDASVIKSLPQNRREYIPPLPPPRGGSKMRLEDIPFSERPGNRDLKGTP